MPYKEGSRQFWFKVNDYKCAYDKYTEKGGYKECGEPAKHIHHIHGETEQLLNGQDPEHSVGLPACEDHHVRNTGEDLGEPNSSFHPDMGHAYGHYKEWKSNEEHMNAITGKRSIDYSTSPFADASKEHAIKAQHGERYINGDDGTDAYYEQKMRNKATLYLAQHPDEKKPQTKPHPKTDRSKAKKWWNFLE